MQWVVLQGPCHRYITIQINANDNPYSVLYIPGPNLLPWLALGLDTLSNKSLATFV